MSTETAEARGIPRFGIAISMLALIIVSAVAGVSVSWGAPGLEFYGRDWLTQWRANLTPPSEVVIVAIDEASLARLGRMPWPRSVMARTLERVAQAQPRVISLAVLFSEPSQAADDHALAVAVAQAGNVVVSAQLAEQAGGHVTWLRPLPEIEQAAAGVVHASVATGFDGVARALTVRQADDDGQAFWALAVETVRVAERVDLADMRESFVAVQIRERMIPVNVKSAGIRFAAIDTEREPQTMRAASLWLDYIGPAGSFAAQTYSVIDVLDDKVAPEKLRGKYVLIGATAAALGDRVASPFMRMPGATDVAGQSRDELMPGVEVLANALHTILRGRFYRELSDWSAFGWAVMAAALMSLALTAAQGRWEFVKQTGAIAGVIALTTFGAYGALARWLIWPPLVPMLVACVAAALLTLLRRALAVSFRLDTQIAELMREDADAPGAASESFRQPRWWPRGSEWKARALGELSRRGAARSRFVERAFRSIEDGLLIAAADGRIVFANPRAAALLGQAGGDLFDCLNAAGRGWRDPPHELLTRAAVARAPIERELTLGDGPKRHCLLRLAAVTDETDGTLHGFFATLADITKQRELQQTRNDVMALVSHELKTPLTAIQSMSEVLAKYEIEAGRQREMQWAINDEARRLARMIDEYLNLTRLESGSNPLRLSPVRIAQLVERVLLLLDPVAAQRQLRIERSFAPQLPALVADEDLIAQALTNLVANALKFSPPQRTVRVEAGADGRWLRIAVVDQGYGIPAEALPHIFEKFYRVPRPPGKEDDDAPGIGLGLAFVRELAGRHNGRVTVESEVGAGSTFTLWLPLDQSAQS